MCKKRAGFILTSELKYNLERYESNLQEKRDFDTIQVCITIISIMKGRVC